MEYGRGRGNQPYFIYQDGELVLDDSFLNKFKSRWMGSVLGDWWFTSLPKSRVLQLLVKFSNYFSHQKKGSDWEVRKKARRMHEQGLDSEVYSPPSDPLWNEAWRITEDLVRLIKKEVTEHNAILMVATLSNSAQVNPNPNERKNYSDSFGVEDLLYPDRRIQHLARKEAIEFVMLAPRLQAWAQEHGVCVHGFENADPCGGHWNENGHRLAGAIIAENICLSLTENQLKP